MKNIKMTEKARKLLGNNEPDSLWDDMGLRSNEHDSITHERLLEFIKVYPVLNISIDNNNYGEFQFISLHVICFDDYGHAYDELLQFWGNGYHEYRGVMQVNWRINVGNFGIYKQYRAMTKKEVLQQVMERRLSIGIGKNVKQQSSGNTFEMLADLSDDDAAMVMMDDLGLE